MKCTAFIVLFAAPFLTSPQKSLGQACEGMFIAADVQVPEPSHLSQVEWALIKTRVIGRCFDDQTMGSLAVDVREVLQNIGYLRAIVSAPSMTTIDSSRYPQSVSVSFDIREGDRYKVREMSIAGYRTLDADQIRSVSQVELGGFLDMSKVRATGAAIERLYAANGSGAKVSQQIEFLTGQDIRVMFIIREGSSAPHH